MNSNPIFKPSYLVEAVESTADKEKGKFFWQKDVLEEEIHLKDLLPENFFQAPSMDASSLMIVQRWVFEAKKYLLNIQTLEEKVGQLFLYEIDPQYDYDQFKLLQNMVLESKVGGILFGQGPLKRECYLIEQMQKLAPVPLLMGHTVEQGFSFLFSNTDFDLNFWKHKDSQYFEDLGKMIMIQNRRLGINFQCIEAPKGDHSVLEKQKAFSRGLKEAQGLSAMVSKTEPFSTYMLALEAIFPHLEIETSPSIYHTFLFHKNLKFFELDETENLNEALIKKLFLDPFDMIKLKSNPEKMIQLICKMIREGKIDQEVIDARLQHLLIIKSVFFLKEGIKE